MDDWKKYQIYILKELERLNDNIEKITATTMENSKQIEVIKFKSGFWGSLSGMITVIIAFFIDHLIRK